jgi:hypothetical protein
MALWTLLALGVTALFSVILSGRGLWVSIRHPNDVSRVSRTWFRRGDGRYREVDETPRPRAAPLRGFCRGNRRPLEAMNASKHSKPNV